MTGSRLAAQALTMISASAGSGKTHRLTEAVTAAVDPAGENAIDLEGLVAVTYTRRAAGELAARIRRTFVQGTEFDSAQRLPLAYIGTVHAVCLRLVKEFAIDGGLSPEVDVLPGGEPRLLQEALEWGLPPEVRSRIQELADSLEIRWDQLRRRTDWITPVQDIMTLARSNRIRPETLPAMAERSVARLLEMLGPREHDENALDEEMRKALEETARALAQVSDGQKNTQLAREQVQDALARARNGRLGWTDWVRLQKIKPGVSAAAAVAPLNAVASRVDRHPRLQHELREFTLATYDAARRGLEAYDNWKKRRRVVDFVDMIDRALTLTESAAVRAELSERLELSVVDEFQDTSPVQLALFVRLHELAKRSTWVGDRKQCIFEYSGADPTLMDAVTEWARESGGTIERLPNNWRSRPELVAACSHLFASAFARHGYAAEDLRTHAQRTTPPELAQLAPFGLWWLEAKNIEEDLRALANGVERLLGKPDATSVLDRTTQVVRGLEPRDICVLVATNAEAEALASVLAQRGIRAAIARAGLLGTPEGTLVLAALRYVLDRWDTLAVAEIDALTGFGGRTGEEWLQGLIRMEEERRLARDRGQQPPPDIRATCVAGLDSVIGEVDALAPSEVLDRVLSVLDVASLCARWPDPEQRLANIDALRALAAEYEEWCARQREAATLAGLIRFLGQSAQKVLVRDEEIASDNQHVTTGHLAVTIATYHKSKGLEWPVVVLGSLDRAARRDAFEVSRESDGAAFDATDPLGKRWIRYWPWPYGAQRKTRLWEIVAASPEGTAVAAREERERVRLLYVGFTRARDHLILAARSGKQGPKTAWLDELCDAEGRPLLEFERDVPENEESRIAVRSVDGTVEYVTARHWQLTPVVNENVGEGTELVPRWIVSPDAQPSERVPYRITPSRAATDWPDLPRLEAGDVESTGERLPLGSHKGVDWDVVGNALHAFLAADLPELDATQRSETARRLLDASGLLAVLGPDSLVKSGDSLRRWVDARWPGAVWRREVSVDALIRTSAGPRRIHGAIDLLLETPLGVVVIDHKTYPGAMSTWRERAAIFAPQLAAYAEALKAAGANVMELWVSFAIAGGVVRLVEPSTEG